MKRHPLAALAAALLLVTPAAALDPVPGAGRDVDVTWKKKTYDALELPEEMPEKARAVVGYWREWALELGYQMLVEENGRYVYVWREKKRGKHEQELLVETFEAFDEYFPVPANREVTDPAPASAPPEQPASDPGDWRSGSVATPYSYSWGVVAPDTQVAAIFETKGDEAYESLIDRIVATNEYMASWGPGAKRLGGFATEQPLVACWREDPVSEETDPENELVNRVAQLALLSRFSQQPYWVQMGSAWFIEMEVLNDIYCFPYRDDFVSIAEHGGWYPDLRIEFRKRDQPVGMADITRFKRGRFDNLGAGTAWGTITFLAKYHPEKLSLALEDMRQLVAEKGKRWLDQYTWEVIPGFEPTNQDQLAVFNGQIGNDFLSQLQDFFSDGKSYKPKKKR